MELQGCMLALLTSVQLSSPRTVGCDCTSLALETLACWLSTTAQCSRAGRNSGIYCGIFSNTCLATPSLRTEPHCGDPSPHNRFFGVLSAMAPLHCLTSHHSLQDKTQTKISPCSYLIKKSFSPQTRTSLALNLACS